jgi:hypothetical protein
MQELQAINEKVKELGWNESNWFIILNKIAKRRRSTRKNKSNKSKSTRVTRTIRKGEIVWVKLQKLW